MIDFSIFRKNPKIWIEQARLRWVELDFKKIIELDCQKAIIKSSLDDLLSEKKTISCNISRLAKDAKKTILLKNQAKDLKDKISNVQSKLKAVSFELDSLILQIPNLLEDCSMKSSERSNFEYFSWNGFSKSQEHLFVYLINLFFKKWFKILISDEFDHTFLSNSWLSSIDYEIVKTRDDFFIKNLVLDEDFSPLRSAILQKDSLRIVSIVKSLNSKKEHDLFCEFFEEILENFWVDWQSQACNASDTHVFESKRFEAIANFEWVSYRMAISSNYWDFLSRRYGLSFLEWRKRCLPHIVDWFFFLYF